MAIDAGAALQEPVEKTDDQKEVKVPDDLAAWVITCIHGFRESAFRESRLRARTAFDYYNSKQWDPEIEQQMKAAKRPAVTFNEIRPKIELLSGEERRNREDWIAKPREGSDDDEANVRTALLKYVRDINNLHMDESRAFEDEIIGGWGGLAAWLVDGADDQVPPLIKVEYRPWNEFAWDWTCRSRDYTDAQWMALVPMVSVDRLTELFPDFEHEIKGEYNALVSDPAVMAEDIGERIGVSRYKDGDMRGGLYSKEGEQIQAAIFYYRISRTRTLLQFGTAQGMQTREIPDKDSDIKTMAEIAVKTGRARYKKITEHAIKGCLVVGRRTLSTWWSPFRGTNAFGVPYFPLFLAMASDTNNHIMGLVEPMIGPQDEINKRWSMTVENYLKQARSGGVYEDGAWEDETTVKKMWGTPGYWAKARSGAISAGKFKEHTAKPTDQALMLLFQHSEATMDRVSNVEKARMGLTSQETSGVAIKQRALQSSLVQVKPFDNFRNMQLQLGRFLNANLQLMFPEETILRLIMPNGRSERVTLNEQTETADGIRRVVNSTRGDLYDITMDLTPGNATFREMQATNLANLLGQIGPPMKELPQFIGPYAMMLKGLIMMLDGIPDREKIAAALDAAVAQGGGMPGGQPAAPGGTPVAPGPGAPSPEGMPFIPAALSNLLKQPGAVSAARTLGP